MARRSPSSKKNKQPRRAAEPAETKAADFMTVGWLVAVMTTLSCELLSVVATWYFRFHPEAKQMSMLAGFLLFASLITGTTALILAAIVWKARRVPPPLGVTAFAVAVSLGPLLILLLR